MPTALNGSEGGAVVFIQGSIIPTTGRRHNYERKARMQPVHRLVHLFASQCIARHSWPWGHLACLEQSRACVPPCRGTTQWERCPPSLQPCSTSLPTSASAESLTFGVPRGGHSSLLHHGVTDRGQTGALPPQRAGFRCMDLSFRRFEYTIEPLSLFKGQTTQHITS